MHPAPPFWCNLKPVMGSQQSGRHFTVAVFVVWDGKVLLHRHRKLAMWLPPGGHIEPNELPDEAAVREVLEETGIGVQLTGERREDVEDPIQLHRPAGVQLENIAPGHQHIDLIYFATPTGPTEIHPTYNEDKVGWYAPEDWNEMRVNPEVRGWCERALSALAGSPLQQPANKADG
jgi:8-oxo-dGTP pyrophosphatase MutT (NUDIX family)